MRKLCPVIGILDCIVKGLRDEFSMRNKYCCLPSIFTNISMLVMGSLIQVLLHLGHLPGLCNLSLLKANPHSLHVAGMTTAR